MNILVKLESVALFGLGIFLFHQSSYAWWWFPTLILLPDLSMIGYLINNKIGAYIYNFFHHQAIAIGLYILGSIYTSEIAQLIGIILFAHSAMDRIFGYGLKYTSGFAFTHLGKIGKS